MNRRRKSANASPQIPTDHEIRKLLRARMSLGHLLNDTQALSSHDYQLLGKFVQTYCVADLEARRMINCLTHIRTGEPTAFALRLNDKDALEHLMACADSCVWNLELAAGIRKAAEIFLQHRKFRHIFAHWAGRRIPGHDVFIFFTSSFSVQKDPAGVVKIEEQEDANVKYAIMPIANLLEEQIKLEGHSKYLANIGSQLHARVEDLAKHFAADVAAGILRV